MMDGIRNNRERLINGWLNNKALLAPLFFLGAMGLIKIIFLLAGLIGTCFQEFPLGVSRNSFWWIATIPLLFLIKIPGIFNFLDSWMDSLEKFSDGIFNR